MTLPGHAACRDEPQGSVCCSLSRARVENDFGDLDDVLWQREVPNRILGHKLQKSGIAKVVAAFKNHALMDELWMLVQVGAQTLCIALIQKVHGAAKYGVLNALVVRQVQLVGGCRFFDMFF